ncbi:MAG: hypothetical protein HYT07_01225 [Candidatus Levybacteria bacterium]|nr:hypothetical protein [Candidatus Levybacteria bacterium]
MIRERESGSINGVHLEQERRKGFGVLLPIVEIDPSRNGENITQPKLFTIIEKKSKPETGKIAGQISFPGETAKIHNEPMGDNIIGGIAEVTDNDYTIRNNIFFMRDSSFIKERIFINGNPFDMAILIHVGPFDNAIKPVDVNEVSPNGPMTIQEIRRKDPTRDSRIVRRIVHQVADLEDSEGLIRRVVSDFFNFPTLRIPLRAILPDGFSSIRDFFQERERTVDVIGSLSKPSLSS